ncbi:MAG: glycosyltransferase family 2 protein [Corynebacterium sp.]|uniref:glycosyltransferase family 2 protein n=1 Tax=Corynebacterium sp. TaxID=1720 RepID=UPI0026DDA65D|nr:glycosyltransferase family 2 protein [Corynebacterium sp.]MDO4761903.1 glycosyltransferase family 2 protein [Corynebacterium sp.]
MTYTHNQPKVTIVIPSMDETDNLTFLLPQLNPHYEVIIVEGKNYKRTLHTAQQLRPNTHVITHPRPGKGNALITGWTHATGDYIIMLDADGSADPNEIPTFITPLTQGADMAKGTRYKPTGGSADLTHIRSLGNRALTLLTNILFNQRFTDLCYGYNAFRTDILNKLNLPTPNGNTHNYQWGDGFEIETLFICRAATAQLTITEVPSFEHHRVHGRSNLHAWHDGKKVLRTILTEFINHHRTPQHQPHTTNP